MPYNHSTEQKKNAILLRKSGKSLRTIAKQLQISLSTAQLWTIDILLSEEQKQSIKLEHRKKLILGQSQYIRQKKNQKIKRELDISTEAKAEVNARKMDPFFMLGLALYWAEGFKKDHSLGFINSDPDMIQQFLKWLKTYGQINPCNIRLRLQIHEIYRFNAASIQLYWSDLLQVPLFQFQAPFYQVSKSKITLIDPTYKGLLRIRVIGTRDLFVRILGWLEGLRNIVYEKRI